MLSASEEHRRRHSHSFQVRYEPLIDILDPVRPVALVKNALQMYEACLCDARVKASFSIDQSYHNLAVDYILLNPARLLQVLINLLTNIIKFTRDLHKRHITILLGASLK